MVYKDWQDLGWKPFVWSWLNHRAAREERILVDMLQRMFDKYVAKVLEFRRKNCRELVPTSHLNAVASLCYLLDTLVTSDNGVDPSDMEVCEAMMEQWFLFSVIWSLCAGVDEEGRKKMDSFIREMEGQFPPKDTVYEYYVDVKTRKWALWEDKLKGS
jgi:dynein heavy chain